MAQVRSSSAGVHYDGEVLLLLDNYDSFTFNLVHGLSEAAPSLEIRVVRNDAITVDEVRRLAPSHIVVSPGPCTPRESGVCPAIISAFHGRVPILGVCLGHQAIGEVHGMTVRRHTAPMHGRTSLISHDGRGVYAGVTNPFRAMRYHSLIVEPSTVPPEFEVSAWTETGEVMGLRWKGAAGFAPLDGMQFHPESFLTSEGPRLLRNFLAGAPADVNVLGAGASGVR